MSDISVIYPFCDLESLLCRVLVRDSDSYELESPGVSGNYDSDVPQVSFKGKLRSRGLLLRLFRSYYVISRRGNIRCC